MTEPPAILVDGLVKHFDELRALDDLTFQVETGEVLGLLGPNGAGKTTAINVLSTLLLPDGGTARVMGHDVVDDADAVRSSISLTGQFAAVDEMLTGHENLVLFGRLRGLRRTDAAARAKDLLGRFSLTEASEQRVGTYSGGMRRRLDLAASLVVETPVLFLDEPTTGLDPRSRNELWDVVRRLRDDGLTIVLTTQYLEEADQLAERIVVVDAGHVVAEGTSDELKATAGGQSCAAEPVDAERLDDLADALRRWAEDPATVTIDDGSVVVAGAGSTDLAAIVATATTEGIGIADVTLRRPTLDDVFLQVTGRHVRTDTDEHDGDQGHRPDRSGVPAEVSP